MFGSGGSKGGQERRLGRLWLVHNHPVALDKALAERLPELEDVKVRGGIALWRPAIFDIADPADHFVWNSWHMSGIERKAINEGLPSMHRFVIPSFRDIIERMLAAFRSPCSR